MEFTTVPTEEALGALLAHSQRVAGGTLKKGRALAPADLRRLADSGIETVVVARLAPDDVGEDAAAARIAEAAAGSNVRVAEPFTGRANLFAEAAGLARIDAAAVASLNARDERVTLASVAPFERVAAGQMLATVKIIPFAVPGALVAGAVADCARGMIGVTPFVPRRAGLVMTRADGTRPEILSRRRAAVEQRVRSLGSVLGAVDLSAHTIDGVQAAIAAQAEAGLDPILVFANSAIVDRGDVIPAGLVAAGGVIERLGMPVDPGNLLLLGHIGDTTVIGIPSCASSLKANGFDWVLERVLAGIAVTSADIGAMGVGGLLKEIESRPQPRTGSVGGHAIGARYAPQIAAIVLAAGRSTRMGTENKLLADVAGVAIVRRTVTAALASPARPVLVVVGHRADEVRAALAGLDVTFVDNPAFASGIASSLRAGVGAVPEKADGAVVLLGDMPEIEPALIGRMIAAFDPAERRTIVVPVVEGRRGNPVLWARAHFADMVECSGDSGAKHLLGQYAEQVVEIAAGGAALADIDTPEALAALRLRIGT